MSKLVIIKFRDGRQEVFKNKTVVFDNRVVRIKDKVGKQMVFPLDTVSEVAIT